MNICRQFKKSVFEYIEQSLSREDIDLFKSHLENCKDCQDELARAMKLYEILDEDTVPEPKQAYFDDLKIKVREREIKLKRFRIPKLARILFPAIAGALLFFLILRPEKYVEMSIPASVLLEDETIAWLSLSGIINDRLIDEMNFVEDSLPFEIEEALTELTERQTQEFIKLLNEQLGSSQEDV